MSMKSIRAMFQEWLEDQGHPYMVPILLSGRTYDDLLDMFGWLWEEDHPGEGLPSLGWLRRMYRENMEDEKERDLAEMVEERTDDAEVMRWWKAHEREMREAFPEDAPDPREKEWVPPPSKALERAIELERQKDAGFDEKTAYWNELYAQGLSGEEIAARMKERFGDS